MRGDNMTEEIEIDGKTYEVHTNDSHDCGYDQGKECAFVNVSCVHIRCCAENRPDKRDVIFIEKQS